MRNTIGKDKINLKQQLFISYYTNPNLNTFGNGLQSYKKAYKTENTNTAKTNASRLLSKAYVSDAIAEELQNVGMDIKVSLSMLAEIIKGEYSQSTVTLDSEGRKSITVNTPSAGAILKAISILNRIDCLTGFA